MWRIALAWRLQMFYEQYEPHDLVGREVSYQKARCDIGILSGASPHDPKVLIEAKAGYIHPLTWDEERPYPSDEVCDDVAKLRKLDFDGERYVLVFLTAPSKYPRPLLRPVVKYSGHPWPDRMHLSKRKLNEGIDRFQAAIGDLPILAKGKIDAGNAFDVDVHYLLFDAS